MCAMNVGNLLPPALPSVITDLTQEKDLMSAVNVGKVFSLSSTSVIREFILEKDTVNLGSLLPKEMPSIDT